MPETGDEYSPGTVLENQSRKTHWENVYASKGETEVSWFQENPAPSLAMLEQAGAVPGSDIIDVGGGASRLVDRLLDRGFCNVTVLDLSEAALNAARARLGDRAAQVRWLVADVTSWEPAQTYDIWHDRAAFHFLTDEADRTAYIARLGRALRIGGFAIIATFAPDGPEKCSGLPIVRYDAASLGKTLGRPFELIAARSDAHATPWRSHQSFQFSLFRRVA